MKAQRVHLITMVLLGMILVGCGPRQKALPNDVINGLQLHYNENDPAGAAALFTDDGAIMSEFGETVRGKTAINNFLKSELKKQLQYWVTSEGNAISGNIAYDHGSMRIRDTSSNRDRETAKYVTIFKKVNGTWKIYRTIYNTDSPSTCASVQIGPFSTGNTEAKNAP